MKHHTTAQKYIAFAYSCALIFILTSGQAEAARRSRVLSTALFASGMSLQFGSSFLKASAQDRYDTYLNAAIQADIQSHKDTFLIRRNAGTIMSRVGMGCVGLAVLFSIYNQVVAPELTENSTSSADRLKDQVETGRTRLSNFANSFSQNTSLLHPRTTFQLYPHYDAQIHRASLRLLHYF